MKEKGLLENLCPFHLQSTLSKDFIKSFNIFIRKEPNKPNNQACLVNTFA